MERNVATISPHEALTKVRSGAALLDVREYPEWTQLHVPGATLIPLRDVKSDPQNAALNDEIVVLCRSGKRATEAAHALADAGVAEPFVVQGGMDAWKAAGLPTRKGEGGPISLERQVRIGAGALMLLGLLVRPFRPICYVVGAGLIFAGLTDRCGLGIMLSKMPWNQSRASKNSPGCESTCAERPQDGMYP